MDDDSPASVAVDLDPSEALLSNELNFFANSNTPISFRFLRPGDQAEIKSLCSDWFPLEYPDGWYDEIVIENKYFSLAACEKDTQRIVGLLVADIFCFGQCNREDKVILHKSFPFATPVCYILILGVVKEYRRQGLAGILLQNLINSLNKRGTCKAIYLHVLFSNRQAIKFYEGKKFQYRAHLPQYYYIEGQNLDGYCFALYINGGYPPFTISDFLSNLWKNLTKTNPCRLLSYFKDYVLTKFLSGDMNQRASSHKQISRII